MARSFLTALNLNKNELQNAAVQNLASAPSAPVKGQLYFDSVGNILYWWNGTSWVSAVGGGGVTYGSVPAETSFGIAKADGVATTVARSDHTHGSPTHVAADHSTIPLSAFAAATAAISLGGNVINNVGTPVAGTDATNKNYVDNMQAGLSWKEACRAATTATLTQSGLQVVDGVTLNANDRVLCKNQTTGSQNGIWLASGSAWTRALDADAVGELEQATVFIQEGTVNKDTAWVCTTDGAITPGTTTTVWAQFGAGTAYTAGAGLTLTGATFDVVAQDASMVINADSLQVGYAGSTGSYGVLTTAARSDHNHGITYVQEKVVLCSAGLTTVYTHNLNTLNVIVQVFRATTPWDTVETDVERTSVNSITVRFAASVAAGDYSIIVMAYQN